MSVNHIRAGVSASLVLLGMSLGSIGDASAAGSKPRCFGRVATLVGTPSDDEIKGTNKRDVIVARAGDDTIYGYDGNDVICGGGGADVIHARYGRDLADGGAGDDDVDGGPDIDHVAGGSGNDEVHGGVGDGEHDTVVGGEGDDVLSVDGNATLSYLFGGPGRDGLYGADIYGDFFYPGSDDTYDFVHAGYEGNRDLVSYRLHPTGVDVDLTRSSPESATGDDFYEVEDIEGSLFDDTLVGDDDVNVLVGNDGNDTISAMGENDTVDGGLGDDVLDGGEHTETEFSRGGDGLSFDDSPVGVDASLVRGTSTGAGKDSFTGFEHLGGSEYSDRLEGDDDDNSLSGSGGYNILLGLGGDDSLWDSSDESDGGPGYDMCEDQRGRNCETWSHADNTSTSQVEFPQHAKTYEPTDVTTVRAEPRNATSLSPPVDRIKVALRVITEDGCLWWSQRRSDLVVRPCGLPLYNRTITIDQPLPVGPYMATSKARLSGTDTWIDGPDVDFSIALS